MHIDKRIVNTEALELVDEALLHAFSTPDARLIISIAPQEGKSQRASRAFPLWALLQNPDLRVAIVSYEYNVARRWGRDIKRDITNNPQLGLKIRSDLKAQSEWQLDGSQGGVVTAGLTGGLTGRPVDLLIIDDPIKDRVQAESETYRDRAWDWWTDVGSTRLAPGAPVVLIQTRWHEDDLAGRLIASEDDDHWEVINIPAQADYDPEKGETDPLGREPGEYLVSARRNKDGRPRTRAQWEAIKRRSGARTWAALYQGNPAPSEGGMFKRDWWRFYSNRMWIRRDDGSYVITDVDEMVISADLAFKDTRASDYVVFQVWARRGIDSYLVDQVRARMDFVKTVSEFRKLAKKWPQALLKLIEDKANGPAVIASLRREIPGIVPENPRGSKEARASAVTPLVEGGNVFLPDPKAIPECDWVDDFIHEHAVFPNGSNDDQVDTASQALNRMVLQPLISGTLVIGDEEEPDLDEIRGWSISPM